MKCQPDRTARFLAGFFALVLGASRPAGQPHGAIFPAPGNGGHPGQAGRGPVSSAPPTARPSDPTSPRSRGAGLPAGAPQSGAGATPQGPLTPTLPNTPQAELADRSDWSLWWEFNKDSLLDLRTQLYRHAATSGEDGFFLGHGYRPGEARLSVRPSVVTVRQEIIPALRRALEDGSASLRSSILIALARVGEDEPHEERTRLEALLRPHLESNNQEVAETAVVALGILGVDSAALLLAEILQDTRAGRQAVGTTDAVSTRRRTFAAYALGLLGARSEREDVRRYVVHKLVRTLDADESSGPDLGIACVLSLGQVPLAWKGELIEGPKRGQPRLVSSREGQVAYLTEFLDRTKEEREVRSFVPSALSGLVRRDEDLSAGGSPELAHLAGTLRARVAADLMARMDPRRREPRELRQACALGLGRLGDSDDDPLDRRIREALKSADGDRMVENFALISRGLNAGRPGQRPAEGLDQERRDLLKLLARGRNQEARWSALALGLFERGRIASGEPGRMEARQALRLALEDASSPADVGAFAIAVGLAGDRESEGPLLEKLRSLSEERARAYAALGLGLVDARDHVEEIRLIVAGSTYKPDLLRDASIALGLLGDRGVVPLLTESLARSSSLSAQASLAQALGRIGDAHAVAPLLELLEDESNTDQARAFAAVALGLVADRDLLPWNAHLAEGLNYAAAPPTLYDEAGRGLLNML